MQALPAVMLSLPIELLLRLAELAVLRDGPNSHTDCPNQMTCTRHTKGLQRGSLMPRNWIPRPCGETNDRALLSIQH